MKSQSSNFDEASIRAAMDQVADDAALRFGALADLLTEWRDPKVARRVVDSLLTGDSDAFREFSANHGFKTLDRCLWLRTVVDDMLKEQQKVTVWRLRTDLTPEQKRLYLTIALQFRQISGGGPYVVNGETTLITDPPFPNPGPVIPDGPFLEALKQAGLVVSSEEVVEGAGLSQTLSPPARTCV